MDTPRARSAATLVVAAVSLLPQWEAELKRHAPSLKVCVRWSLLRLHRLPSLCQRVWVLRFISHVSHGRRVSLSTMLCVGEPQLFDLLLCHTHSRPMQVLAYHGQWRKKITPAMLLQADVVLTSYSMLRFVVEETDRIEWHRVVFDEAHYMKSATTITTILCKRLLAKHRWCLTGASGVALFPSQGVVVRSPLGTWCVRALAPICCHGLCVAQY